MKTVYIVLVVITILIAMMSPFIVYGNRVKDFCINLESSGEVLDIDKITRNAKEHHLSIRNNPNKDFLIVFDRKTMGTTTCYIDYSKDIIKYNYTSD